MCHSTPVHIPRCSQKVMSSSYDTHTAKKSLIVVLYCQHGVWWIQGNTMAMTGHPPWGICLLFACCCQHLDLCYVIVIQHKPLHVWLIQSVSTLDGEIHQNRTPWSLIDSVRESVWACLSLAGCHNRRQRSPSALSSCEEIDHSMWFKKFYLIWAQAADHYKIYSNKKARQAAIDSGKTPKKDLYSEFGHASLIMWKLEKLQLFSFMIGVKHLRFGVSHIYILEEHQT